MKVKDLIDFLSRRDQEKEVFIQIDDCDYMRAYSVSEEMITIEDPTGEEDGIEVDVVIIGYE